MRRCLSSPQVWTSTVYLPDTLKWNGALSPKQVIQLADQLHKCCLLETFVPRRNAFWLLSIQVVKKDNLLKNQGSGPREMAQCLNVAVLSVNPSLVPSTDVREIKTTCDQSGFRWFRTLLLASTDPYTCMLLTCMFLTGFLCVINSLCHPGTPSIDQAGLKLTKICLPCLPSAEIKGVCHHHHTQVTLVVFLN